MFHVYTKKDGSELTKTLVGEFKDFEEAMNCAESAVAGKEGMKFVVEETSGHFNSYGELLSEVVAEG